LITVMGKLSEVVESVTTGGGKTAVPLSATLCGEPLTLSATFNEALSDPATLGLKATVTVHDALTANDDPQLLVCVNEVGLEPVSATLEIAMAAVPVFFSVTACVADELPVIVVAKLRLAVDTLTRGTPMPVPVSATVCGEPVALSTMLSDAGFAPTPVGLKVTAMVHDELTASEVPQVLVCA